MINEDVFSSEGLEKYERYQCEILEPSYEVSPIRERNLIYNVSEAMKEDPELYDWRNLYFVWENDKVKWIVDTGGMPFGRDPEDSTVFTGIETQLNYFEPAISREELAAMINMET